MNEEKQNFLLEIIKEKENIKEFLLTETSNREIFKEKLIDLKKKNSFATLNDDTDLDIIIDELLDLYNSLLNISRFKNTQAKSMSEFNIIMDNITKFINSGAKYNKDILNIIIIGLKEQYNEIIKLLQQKNNKRIIKLFREKYLKGFDDKIATKEEKISLLKDISEEISKEISKEITENEIFDILKKFIKHQTQFYNLTNFKIFSFLLNSTEIRTSIYDRIDLYRSFEEMEFEDLKKNVSFLEIVENIKEKLSIQELITDDSIIDDEDIYFICYLMIKKILNSGIEKDMIDFGGGINKKHQKLIKEIQSFLKKYKNRNNNKLINILKLLKKSQ